MEVLLMKKETALVIGDAVLVILKTSRNQVQIGIEAPRNVNLVRAELLYDELENLTERVRNFKNYEI